MKQFFLALFLFTSVHSFAQFHISGTVYYDNNYTHMLDNQDVPILNKYIQIKQIGSSVIYNVQTDNFGFYDMQVAEADYQVYFNDSYDTANYKPTDTVTVNFVGSAYETADFAFQPKAPPPTYVGAQIYNNNTPDNLPEGGSTQYFTLHYGFTNPLIASMQAKVIVDFNPKLSLAAASLPPTVSLPGHLEWNFNNLQQSPDNPFNNPGDTINCSFIFPAVGDTISGFEIKPSFIPGMPLDSIDKISYVQSVRNSIEHLPQVGSGSTSGIKWMHSFGRQSTQYYPTDLGNSIDTAYTGNGYFITANKQVHDSVGYYNYYVFVSKINADGLPLWEKEIDGNLLGLRSFNAVTIKSLPDGGCVVFGSIYDSGAVHTDKIGAFKLDSAGNIIWHHALNNYLNEYVMSAVNTADNGVLFTGYSEHNIAAPAGSGRDSIGRVQLIITKLSVAGDLVWKKEYGGSNDDGGFKLVPLKNGTYLILGATSSTDGDVVGAHQHGYYINTSSSLKDTVYNIEGWVLNVDANGNMLWNKCYGGSADGFFIDAAESAGGILLSGFTHSKNGDLPYYPESAVPLWLLQISNTGTINWSKLYKFYAGYTDSNYVYSPLSDEDGPWFYNLSPTKDGNFVLGGNIADRYGTIKAKHGKADFSFMKINPAGNILWQKAVGGTGYEYFSSSVADKNDDIVFIGSSQSKDDDLYGRNGDVNGNEVMMIGKIGITNIIKGKVFVDNNNNGIQDAGELFYSNGRVQSAKIRDTVTGYIFNGQFLNNVDTGNYVTIYMPVNNYYTVLPATHSTSFTTLDQTDIVNFALKPKPNINDLEVQLLPLSAARPGFENHYRIITKNVGTTTISNTITSLKKDSRQVFVSSGKPFSGILADSIWWGPVTLNAFDIDTVDVVLQNAAPPTLNNGDILTLTATASPVASDSSAANNSMTVKQILTGSYDPNDKTEMHGGQLTPVAYSNNEYLQYLIRFQNTGSDTAFFVTVKDTLDTKLNLSTVEVLAASHHYDFKLEKNVATWNFQFIKLTDTVTNEPASHGYILFRVKPKAGLVLGDVFSNKAAIYFDFNLPVITNSEKTMLTDGNSICPGGNIKFTSSITGASYQWQVNTGSGYTNISNGAVYTGAGSASLQLTAPPTSMYGYQYRCVVNGTNFSSAATLKFAVTWIGAASTDWQTAANWSCGVLPDAATDVFINTITPNFPVVNSNVSCRSIKASAGVSVLVKAGVQLLLTGNK